MSAAAIIEEILDSHESSILRTTCNIAIVAATYTGCLTCIVAIGILPVATILINMRLPKLSGLLTLAVLMSSLWLVFTFVVFVGLLTAYLIAEDPNSRVDIRISLGSDGVITLSRNGTTRISIPCESCHWCVGWPGSLVEGFRTHSDRAVIVYVGSSQIVCGFTHDTLEMWRSALLKTRGIEVYGAQPPKLLLGRVVTATLTGKVFSVAIAFLLNVLAGMPDTKPAATAGVFASLLCGVAALVLNSVYIPKSLLERSK